MSVSIVALLLAAVAVLVVGALVIGAALLLIARAGRPGGPDR